MKALKKEQNILNIIKYGPILFVLTLSIVFTQYALHEKEKAFNQEIQLLEETFLNNNKKRVQEEIDEIYTFITNEKKNAETLLKESIKTRVYEAHAIATNIYNTNPLHSYNKETKAKKFEAIKNALGAIIYNKGRGYFFMDNVHGIKLLQPLNKEFEGRNLLNFKDAKGYKFVQKIVQTIKNKTESYDSYYWYKAGDPNNAFKKISFYKYFEPYDVAIGTGEYVKDFEDELKQKVLKHIQNKRYADKGYIFVYDYDGNCLSHYNQNHIGKNRLNYQNKNGRYLVKDIIEFTRKNREGFMNYSASMSPIHTIDSNEKISYTKLFEEWNWVIGTGFYTDALKSQIQKRKEQLIESNEESIKSIIYLSVIVTLLFIFISFTISRFIKIRFESYKASLNHEMEKSLEQEKLLYQQSKMATMGEMIANIAHQWKQPLNLISMSNGLLKMNHQDKSFSDPKEIEDAMKHIDESVFHLSETIDDFRNFFKPDKQKEYFFIANAFQKTATLMQSQFKHNNIEIIQDNLEDIEIYAYQNELLQVLVNIIKNAKDELIKLPRGQRRLIILDVVKKENMSLIKIKDNAGGIKEELMDKIFDSYFTTKSSKEGTGIGLYMSKQIIEGMQGSIKASNVEYKYEEVEYHGAEFTITLPLK